MHNYDYQKLLAEKNTLERLMANIPERAIVDRMSLQSRIDNVKQQIDAVNVKLISKKAIVTFRGKPVDESHGITAEFSGKAINGLNEMVASVVASLNNNLKFMGPIPNREQHQLMITGTAVGSFGFEFELPAPKYDIFAEKNGTETALSDIYTLLKETTDSVNDDISEIVSKLHPRAIKKILEFLIILQKSEALFAMQHNEKVFRVETPAQLDTIINRLNDADIEEREEVYTGEFLGVLPKSRTFEFVEHSSKDVIKGKIDASVLDPETINLDYLHKPISVTFSVLQNGQAKPKYTLLKLSDINI